MKRAHISGKFVVIPLQRLLCLLTTFLLAAGLHAQDVIKVTGTVTDASKNAPIAGVSVGIKDGKVATATDDKGSFTVSVSKNAVLVFSFIGFASQEVAVNGKSVVNASLKATESNLNDVIVVGYGSTKKATLTGSVASVKGDVLQKSPLPNVTNSLGGRLPGLVAVTRTGEPGNDASLLRIRGSNTLGDNSPLIVVDGIANRSIDRLDPADIASVNVLKDASAAIYGAQAANGVILVTTKRGLSGKPQLQINMNGAMTSPTVLPKMADAATYAQLINEIKHYANEPLRYTDEDIQKYKDGSDPWGHPNTDWFKETVKPWSPQYYGNMSLSGGSDNIKYLISIGHNYQDGMYYNSATNYSQTNFRSNIDAKISNSIKLSLDLQGNQENRNYSGITGEGALNPFWAMNRAYPYLPARWPNGLPGPDVEYGANSTVIVTDATGYDKNIAYIFQSNLKLDISIPWVKGLSVTGNASFDKNLLTRKLFQKPWYLYTLTGYDANNQPILTKGIRGFSDARLTESLNNTQRTTLNALINYETTIGTDHAVKALLGTERISGDLMFFSAYRRNFTSTALDELFAGGDLLKDNTGTASQNARLNYFGRVNYAYQGKYLAEFVFRYDGSYIFPEHKQYGFFPGVSLGWRVSQENFWKNNISFINELKIRGSLGRTGNDRIDPYQFLSSYGYSGTYVFNSGVAVKQVSELRIPNPDVTWEIADQGNIGFDAQLFNGKLSITADYFHNYRSNILWWRNASVPATTGLSLPRQNIGEVLNQGFETQVGYNNRAGAFTYAVSANVAYAKNKIMFWDETPGVPSYQQTTGHPMNAQLYYQAIGVFRDQKAVDNYPHWAGARPGDLIFEDVNKDGKIDGLDQKRDYKTDIPTVTGGFSFDLGYKNFYLSGLIQGAAGAERSYRTFSGEAGNFLVHDIEGRWTEDNIDAKKPRTWNRSKEYWMTDGAPNNTYWVRSSDYLRLKSVELGYNFSSSLIKKWGLTGLRIYVSGANLITITKMQDFDPESPNQDDRSIWVNSQVYPLMKVLNAGLSVNF
ncbi:TonB-dependent receptor [Danxiaibacter flavus]|uniref:TonB-dependent receptor n=1 Tax=Danxiaibacter flavus TaxID=3049108 RepID=A0ABV3ZJ84_9BACT|nr:TonB-dependent receptor [Chitinophagaceae bacterium DXS]